MNKISKIAITIAMASIAVIITMLPAMAASHDVNNPTRLPLNTEYESNAGYGDEYYTFDIKEESNVYITAYPVATLHHYTFILTGNNISPIITTSGEDEELELNTTLGSGTYYLTLTSDLIPQPLGNTAVIMTEPDEAWYDIIVEATPCYPQIDNSNSDYFPPIADQGSGNSSVGYATTYYQMTYTVSRALDSNYSNHIFSPLWTYSLVNSGIDGGAYASDAYKVLDKFGAPLSTEFTGNETSIETNAEVWKSAMQYRLNADRQGNHYAEETFNDTEDFIYSMKNKLAAGEVLVTGSNSGWWYGDDSNESVKVLKNGVETSDKGVAYVNDNGKDEGRQFITVVGYDNDIVLNYGSYSTKGAFKIANSIGTDWGNGGYIWVSYDAFYQTSSNRPVKKNGYGFTSSWWWPDMDQNVYYSMAVSEQAYNPEYVGILTFNNQDISDMKLSYRGRNDLSSDISGYTQIFDNTEYIKGITSVPFTGSIAVDLSGMSPYFTNEGACWEMVSDEISSAELRIYSVNNDMIYNGTGTAWHIHVYDRKDDFSYSNNQWHRYDRCAICDTVHEVSGSCILHMDFSGGTGTWGNNGYAYLSRVLDENDNYYLNINYLSESDITTGYFEICNPSDGAYTTQQISGEIEMSFDVRFAESADADIILKRRQPDIDNIVLRVCSRENGRLMYGCNQGRQYFTNSTGWINSLNTWYTIEISANITTDSEKARQSIRVINRETGELVSEVNDVKLQNNDSFCNLLVIGGAGMVSIDNIAIRKI